MKIDKQLADLMTIEEVAAVLRINRKTLLNWRPIGLGPQSFKLGKAVRYERAEVFRWLAAQRAAGPRGAA